MRLRKPLVFSGRISHSLLRLKRGKRHRPCFLHLSRAKARRYRAQMKLGGENPDKDMLVKKIASQIAILADIEDVDDMRALSKMLDGLVPWDGDVDWDVMRKFGIEEVIRRRVEAIRETPKT